MREIKFRAYNESVKKMTHFEKPNLILNDDIGLLFEVKDVMYMTSYSELMQCTGLKDKNGKEIYEGDIVSDESYGEDIGRLVDNVVWNNEKGAWVWGKDEVAFIADSVDTIMIIGNIYENPELLEVNK